MPVIINDFDIMADAPEPPPVRGRGPEDPAPETPAAPTLRPEDIKRVMQLNRERMERVRAD